MLIKLIADNGLPLKITAEWTDETYWNRRSNYNDNLDEVRVQGWLVRINGKKYPRDNIDGNGYPDWTYRYTPMAGKGLLGKYRAIQQALQSAGLRVKSIPQKLVKHQKRLHTWSEQMAMKEGFSA